MFGEHCVDGMVEGLVHVVGDCAFFKSYFVLSLNTRWFLSGV